MILIHSINGHIPALHQLLNGGNRVKKDFRRLILGQLLRCLINGAQTVVIIDNLIDQPFLHTQVAVIDIADILYPLR